MDEFVQKTLVVFNVGVTVVQVPDPDSDRVELAVCSREVMVELTAAKVGASV